MQLLLPPAKSTSSLNSVLDSAPSDSDSAPSDSDSAPSDSALPDSALSTSATPSDSTHHVADSLPNSAPPSSSTAEIVPDLLPTRALPFLEVFKEQVALVVHENNTEVEEVEIIRALESVQQSEDCIF